MNGGKSNETNNIKCRKDKHVDCEMIASDKENIANIKNLFTDEDLCLHL